MEKECEYTEQKNHLMEVLEIFKKSDLEEQEKQVIIDRIVDDIDEIRLKIFKNQKCDH